MELKIRLHRLRGTSLPVNYQYPLSSWIYKIIGAADAGYSAFLHEKGFSLGARKFKMFTFSQLDLRPYEISGERIVPMKYLRHYLNLSTECSLLY